MQHLTPRFKKSIILLQKFRSNFRILKHFKVPHKNEILKCVPVRISTFIRLRFWRPGQFLKKKKKNHPQWTSTINMCTENRIRALKVISRKESQGKLLWRGKYAFGFIMVPFLKKKKKKNKSHYFIVTCSSESLRTFYLYQINSVISLIVCFYSDSNWLNIYFKEVTL